MAPAKGIAGYSTEQKTGSVEKVAPKKPFSARPCAPEVTARDTPVVAGFPGRWSQPWAWYRQGTSSFQAKFYPLEPGPPQSTMTFYWFLFLLPALWALKVAKPRYLPSRSASQSLLWFLLLVGLTLVIGLRHEVGGDWGGYLPFNEAAQGLTLEEAIFKSDPGYSLLNWIGANWGGGIYLVNTLCGLLFSLGLIVFCRQLPRPWLALAIAMPYLVLVVAMGYSRQGVALGIAMWGLSLLERGQLWRFVIAIALAGLFHKSAVALIFIALASRTKNKFLTAIAIAGIGVGLYMLLLADAVDALRVGYLDAEYQSSGAGVRVAMNALPSLIFLWFRKRFVLTPQQRQLWTYMAWASIGFVGLLFASPSSTAVDRVALYLIPVQLFVWSHFPDAVGRIGRKNLWAVLMVLAFYSAVLFVWLFFADHRYYWIPYKSLLFEFL